MSKRQSKPKASNQHELIFGCPYCALNLIARCNGKHNMMILEDNPGCGCPWCPTHPCVNCGKWIISNDPCKPPCPTWATYEAHSLEAQDAAAQEKPESPEVG